MTDTEVIALIGALLTIVGGALGLWWRIEGRIKAAETAATLKAEAAFAAAQMLADKLAEHRLHSAETFVTKVGHRESTDQIMTAIGEVKASMNGMATNLTTRLDRMFENQTK